MQRIGDWRDEVLIDQQMEEDYQGAVASGDVPTASALGGQIKARRARGERQAERTSAAIEAKRPRGPRKGEEAHLSRSLERIAKECAKWEKRKADLLRRVADNPDDGLFARLQDVDARLQNLAYEKAGICGRLEEIERHHQAVEASRRQEKERAERKKAEAERREKIAQLDKLTGETSAAWLVVTRNLAAIRRGAAEIQEPEGRWLQGILDASGARECMAPVAGLPSGSWAFPVPERR